MAEEILKNQMNDFKTIDKPIRRINPKAVKITVVLALGAIGAVIALIPEQRIAKRESTDIDQGKIAISSENEIAPALAQLPKAYDDVGVNNPSAMPSHQVDYNEPEMPSEPAPDSYYPRNNGYDRQAYQPPENHWDNAAREDDARAAQEFYQARKSAGIFINKSNQATATTVGNREDRMLDLMERSLQQGIQGSSPNSDIGTFINHNENSLSNKERFAQNPRKGTRMLNGQLPKYAITQGTIFAAVLLSEINSDLPGPILAQVTESIYDTKTGRNLVIPQGAKLVGEYNSNISHGQKRAQVMWTRMILPNTDSIELGRMPGIDAKGASGHEGEVNNHYDKLAMGVLFSSLLSTGVSMSQGPTDPHAVTPQQQIGQSVTQEVMRTGSRITDRELNVQPTIKVKAGTKINVFSTDDVWLKPYRRN